MKFFIETFLHVVFHLRGLSCMLKINIAPYGLGEYFKDVSNVAKDILFDL